MTNYIKDNNKWIKNSRIFVKANNVWTQYTDEQFSAFTSGNTFFYGGFIDRVHTLAIAGYTAVTTSTYSLSALYDGMVFPASSCFWSLVYGSEYASIDNRGKLTIAPGTEGLDVIVRATYLGISDEKTINVTYKESATTETSVTVDESGNTITTIITETDNGDGSSTIHETVIATDEDGNVLERTEYEVNNNADGSYVGSSVTYDGNGGPMEGQNVSGDTSGNISTQDVEYDESGNTVVVGYSVDTSGNPDGVKTYNADGVNTEYYAFDMTHGFVLHMHFTINFNAQPAGQSENHHNILTMKRATPSPWYGFQLRQTGTNKFIIVGAQFSTGSNTNTNISGETTSSANTYEYDLTITYNPTASTNAFVCYNNLKSENVYRSNNKFPDIDDLKYLKVTIGYAMDENGDPFRYSNINVLDFSITRT